MLDVVCVSLLFVVVAVLVAQNAIEARRRAGDGIMVVSAVAFVAYLATAVVLASHGFVVAILGGLVAFAAAVGVCAIVGVIATVVETNKNARFYEDLYSSVFNK